MKAIFLGLTYILFCTLFCSSSFGFVSYLEGSCDAMSFTSTQNTCFELEEKLTRKKIRSCARLDGWRQADCLESSATPELVSACASFSDPNFYQCIESKLSVRQVAFCKRKFEIIGTISLCLDMVSQVSKKKLSFCSHRPYLVDKYACLEKL